jgi:hypothetical protein
MHTDCEVFDTTANNFGKMIIILDKMSKPGAGVVTCQFIIVTIR